MSFLFGATKTTNSSQTPTLTPQGQSLYSQLLSYGSGVMNNPGAGLQPIQTAGEEAINSSYGNIPDAISQEMARRGYGSSGSFGNTLYQTQLGRLGALGNFRGQMAGLASQRQMGAAQLMSSMLGTQVGSQGYSKTTTMDPGAAFGALGALLMAPTGGGSSILGDIWNMI